MEKLLSCLVLSVYAADTTSPLSGPKNSRHVHPSVMPPCFFPHTHVPACLHVCSPHDHGALASGATALSSVSLQHPLSRSVIKPSRVTFLRYLSPAGHTGGTGKAALASVPTWHLYHGATDRIPSTNGSVSKIFQIPKNS